jgi:ABC-2 type transport system ATP-binding protein
MAKDVLQVEGLRKSFPTGFMLRKKEVLHGVSFRVKANTVTGFVGVNGAGKTTTIRSIMNFIFPDTGVILYFGHHGFSEDVRSKVGYLPERPYFYDYLKGIEFLRLHWNLQKKRKSQNFHARAEEVLKSVDLWEAREGRLRTYSKGMLQRIGFAQAILHEPEFLVLDEPMSGLDPDGRKMMKDMFRATAQKGTAIFFSSHLLQDMEELCKDIVILDGGSTLYQGDLKNFLEDSNPNLFVRFRDPKREFCERMVNFQDLQAEIDKIRQGGNEIIEIQRQNLRLEDAFHKLRHRAGTKGA